MKLDEEFLHDRDHSFLTDDEENQADLACSDDEHDGDGRRCGANSDTSSPLSRNRSDNNLTDVPNPPWPQSYRRSMDLMTGMTPPSVSFMPRSLSRRSGSSFHKKQQSSFFDSFSSSASKPLLSQPDPDKEDTILPSHFPSQLKLSVTDLPLPQSNLCSVSQSILNGTNVLCGLGLITMPYAIKESGWLGLLILSFFGVITCYTGILLKRCLESSPGLQTYPDIGQAAFGITGRCIISILLYIELYAACVEYIIMMSDNLSGLFPNVSLGITPGLSLDSAQTFAVLTTILVLPTVWLKDLSLLSYLSVGGVLASVLLGLCLFWVGAVDGIGFHATGKLMDFGNLPVAIGIFGFGYSGHSVFPNIYSSMKDPSKFPLVLVICFGFCTVLYIAIAVCGYTMFGEALQSQFTLNMPKHFLPSKIAVWTAVVTPMTKYALTITPIVLSLEELIPMAKMRSHGVSILFRTILVISTLVVALSVPFFAIVAALIGSFLAMLVRMEFENRYGIATTQKYDCLLFDLDDTLYPLSTGIARECGQNIKDYMVEELGIPKDKIVELSNLLYKNYGTTMAGLRAIGYDFDYDEYHSFVHGRLPYDNIKPDPVLRSLLLSLPLRKVIFTNADRVHAVKALKRLGLEDCFEGIICFETLNPTHTKTASGNTDIFDIVGHFDRSESVSLLPKTPIVCKPSDSAIENALEIANIDPSRTLFFEDSVRNVQAGKRVGLDTVLVGASNKVKGADYVLENIHNMKEALPELWKSDRKSADVGYSGKVAVETPVTA